MTYADIITEICTQLGDPNKDTYESRAQAKFTEVLNREIQAGSFTDEDVKGYIVLKSDVDFGGGGNTYEDISSLNIASIRKIFCDPRDDTLKGYGLNIVLLTLDEFAMQGSEGDEYIVTQDEIHVVKIGDKLYIHVDTNCAFTPGTDSLMMVYVKYPDPAGDGWIDGTVLSDSFSLSFIYKIISLSVKELLTEDELSPIA